MINIGVLGSTNGTDLQAVLDAADKKMIDASINIVISNRKNAYILKRSAARGVETSFVSQKNKTREKFDREITSLLEAHQVELVLLIGFMRILSQEIM